MTQWPELGKRLALWEAVYHGQEAKVQKLLSSPNGIQQVNIPHGVRSQAWDGLMEIMGILIRKPSCAPVVAADKPPSCSRCWESENAQGAAVCKCRYQRAKCTCNATHPASMHVLMSDTDLERIQINGTTPLHIAVEKCRKDLVQDLLLVGANPMLRNVRLVMQLFYLRKSLTCMWPKHTGKNAIQMAMDRGMKDVAVMLEQQAATLQFHAAQMDHARQQTQEKVQRTGATRPHESQAATPI